MDAFGKAKPSTEFATHLVAYWAREDVEAVVYAHPPAAVALITSGVTIPSMTPEHAVTARRLEV